MPTYEVGQTLVFGLKVYDAANALADVGTGPTATVTKPDGTTASASVTKVTTGTYTATYTASAAGRWRCVWAGSGANSGGLPYTDVADVWPADPRLIISLADARAALNVATSSVVNDDELRQFVVGAGIVVDHLVGTVLTQTQVEYRSGGGKAGIGLYQHPQSITSVVEDGTTLAAGDYCFDEAGILWRGSQPGAGAWSSSGVRNVVITMVAGTAVVTENIRLAAAHLVRHWWTQSQQSYRPYMGGVDEPMTTMVAGYAVPNFVVDLLAPSLHHKVPGIA